MASIPKYPYLIFLVLLSLCINLCFAHRVSLSSSLHDAPILGKDGNQKSCGDEKCRCEGGDSQQLLRTGAEPDPGTANEPDPEIPGTANEPDPENPSTANEPDPENPGTTNEPGPENPGTANEPDPENPSSGAPGHVGEVGMGSMETLNSSANEPDPEARH